jgi:hypothetical protein
MYKLKIIEWKWKTQNKWAKTLNPIAAFSPAWCYQPTLKVPEPKHLTAATWKAFIPDL